jgi:hypothetical protein
MLAYKYCTCQGKVEANLEVIGGAGVSGVGEFSVFSFLVVSGGRAEIGKLKLENRNGEGQRPENGARAKFIKTKRLAKYGRRVAHLFKNQTRKGRPPSDVAAGQA